MKTIWYFFRTLSHKGYAMIIRDHGAFEAARYGIKRSRLWKAIVKGHLKREPVCAACDPEQKPPLWRRLLGLGPKRLVHHIIPFHVAVIIGRPELELDSRNLITLCETHHLLIGHFGNYESWAFSIKKLAKVFQGLTEDEILTDATYREFVRDRPMDIGQMTPQEIENIRVHVNVIMPQVKHD